MKKSNFPKIVRSLPYAASAGMAVAKLVDSSSKLSEKSPEHQKNTFKNFGVFLASLLGAICLGKWIWDASEAKKYHKQRLVDAEVKVIETALRGSKGKESDDDEDEGCERDSIEEEVAKPTQSFIEDFNSRFSMPQLPPFLAKIMNGVPKGYEIPMLFHLLSMLGALCFSRIRAKYFNDKIQAPNLQVIIEGIAGVGKGKFTDLYKALFSRVIDDSNERITSGTPGRVIQTIGVGTSISKFIDLLAGNKGCHVYIYDSELSNLANDMKKNNGLNSEILRYAYDNETYNRNNRSNASQGSFPVYLNYTITGTSEVVMDFFKHGLENGTIQRVCFIPVPEAGRELQSLKLPNPRDLETMKDQIDEWKEKYCFTESQEGDKVVKEQEIDLSYVLAPLNEWLGKQYDLSEQEENPARSSFRGRAANNAFRCAMILHMLWGQPGKDSPKRQYVIDGALYIANYCAERLLHKFGKEQNEKIRANYEAECVENISRSIETETQSELITDVAKLARLHRIKNERGQNQYGWDTLSKMSGIPRSTLINKIKAYENSAIAKK